MSFSNDNGYVPTTIDEIMASVMDGINTQFGTSYTTETFLGTNFYKYFYAIAQRLLENETKTAEIFTKLQQYFTIINAMISRPVVTNPGLIEKISDEGYVASVKPMIDADAGKVNICVDVDDGDHAEGTITISSYANLVSGTADTISVDGVDFTAQAGAATPGDATFQAATSNAATAASLATQINAHATVGAAVKATANGAVVTVRAVHGGTAGNSIALAYTDNDANVGASVSEATLSGGTDSATYAATRLAICTIIKDSVVAGAITQGTEVETIVLSNGQSFDFKYYLPNRMTALLRLTTTLSENNQVVIGDPDQTKLNLLANIDASYRLGKNFEPQKYFSVVDAPWCSKVLLEYSLDGGSTYSSDVYDANYDDLFTIDLANITLVEE